MPSFYRWRRNSLSAGQPKEWGTTRVNSGRGIAAAIAGLDGEPVAFAADMIAMTYGRFRGGWTTRHYGRPQDGVHAIQMELACRGYMDEPAVAEEDTWPTPYDPMRAKAIRAALTDIPASLSHLRGRPMTRLDAKRDRDCPNTW